MCVVPQIPDTRPSHHFPLSSPTPLQLLKGLDSQVLRDDKGLLLITILQKVLGGSRLLLIQKLFFSFKQNRKALPPILRDSHEDLRIQALFSALFTEDFPEAFEQTCTLLSFCADGGTVPREKRPDTILLFDCFLSYTLAVPTQTWVCNSETSFPLPNLLSQK